MHVVNRCAPLPVIGNVSIPGEGISSTIATDGNDSFHDAHVGARVVACRGRNDGHCAPSGPE